MGTFLFIVSAIAIVSTIVFLVAIHRLRESTPKTPLT